MEDTNKKKIPKCGEIVYILAQIFLPLGTAMITKADFGVSVVVAPAYICSLKLEQLFSAYVKPGFSFFGPSEWLIQGLLLIIFCIVMRKIKWQWLCSFVTAFIYGGSLNFFLFIFAKAGIGTEESPLSLPMRIVFFIAGSIIACFGVALFLEAYFPPEVYELFVKGISEKFKWPFARVKMGYDITSLIISLILSFVLMRSLEGIGIGTAVSAITNGLLIGFFKKMLEKFCDFGYLIKPAEKAFPRE